MQFKLYKNVPYIHNKGIMRILNIPKLSFFLSSLSPFIFFFFYALIARTLATPIRLTLAFADEKRQDILEIISPSKNFKALNHLVSYYF